MGALPPSANGGHPRGICAQSESWTIQTSDLALFFMNRHLIIGASGGIGAAIAKAIGGEVVTLSREADGLDFGDLESVSSRLENLEGPFDSVVVATGILAPSDGAPEKSLAALHAGSMEEVFRVNTFGPALILGQLPRLLARDQRSVVGVLSARVGSIGDNRIGGWHSYRASKAALNQLVRGAAIELARTHKNAVVLALHPGTVATPFSAKYAGRHPTVRAEVAAANLLAVMRRATPDMSGGFYDYSGAKVPW